MASLWGRCESLCGHLGSLEVIRWHFNGVADAWMTHFAFPWRGNGVSMSPEIPKQWHFHVWSVADTLESIGNHRDSKLPGLLITPKIA